MFSCESREISENTFFTEYLWATASWNRAAFWKNIMEVKVTNEKRMNFLWICIKFIFDLLHLFTLHKLLTVKCKTLTFININ